MALGNGWRFAASRFSPSGDEPTTRRRLGIVALPRTWLMTGLLAAPVATWLAGCDGSISYSQYQAAAESVLVQLASAPSKVAHEGQRLVELYGDGKTLGQALIYREIVQTDGQGGFALIPEEVIASGAQDPFTFMQGLIKHEGFNFRYRDFRILDAARALENYQLLSYGTPTTVAGRACQQLEIRRKSRGSQIAGRRYLIDFDSQTALVLRAEEYSAAGQLVSRMAYETFSEGMPVSMVPKVLENGEFGLQLEGSLLSELGFEALKPSFLPQGFGLRARSKVIDLLGHTWLKLVYSDGIEPLFVVARPSPIDHSHGPQSPLTHAPTSTGFGPASGSAALQETMQPGRVLGAQAGALGVLQAWFSDWRLICVGRQSLDDLQLILESTL